MWARNTAPRTCPSNRTHIRRRRRGTKAQAARARSGTETHTQGTETRATLHRASAALQRGITGEGTRRARYWAAVNVFGHSFHDSGKAVRPETGRKVYAHRDW